jgi:hypothetical protein
LVDAGIDDRLISKRILKKEDAERVHLTQERVTQPATVNREIHFPIHKIWGSLRNRNLFHSVSLYRMQYFLNINVNPLFT